MRGSLLLYVFKRARSCVSHHTTVLSLHLGVFLKLSVELDKKCSTVVLDCRSSILVLLLGWMACCEEAAGRNERKET